MEIAELRKYEGRRVWLKKTENIGVRGTMSRVTDDGGIIMEVNGVERPNPIFSADEIMSVHPL